MVQRVVLAGGGLAALRTAESLRRHGFDGLITAVGAEAHLPYTRPPLSKTALSLGADAASLAFRTRLQPAEVDWRLGVSAVGADLAAQAVALSDGSTLHYDALVIATGLRARRLAPESRGTQVLRVVEDAERVRARLGAGQHLLVLGSGFVGCEAAASARAMQTQVTVASLDAIPLARLVGDLLGTEIREHHEASGVRFISEVTVDDVGAHGRVTLSNGEQVVADVIIEAVGATPNVQWLEGTGLDTSDGVLVDNALRVIGPSGSPIEGVHAAGDLARYPNPLFDDVPRRVEHWTNASETGRRAGAALAQFLDGDGYDRCLAEPFTPMPYFWSDQGTLRLECYGLPAVGDQAQRIDSADAGASILAFTRSGELVAVAGHGAGATVAGYARDIGRSRLAAGA